MLRPRVLAGPRQTWEAEEAETRTKQARVASAIVKAGGDRGISGRPIDDEGGAAFHRRRRYGPVFRTARFTGWSPAQQSPDVQLRPLCHPQFRQQAKKALTGHHARFGDPDGPIERINGTGAVEAEAHSSCRIAQVRRAIEAHDLPTAVAGHFLRLPALTPDALARVLREAMELAASGRDGGSLLADGDGSLCH